MLDHQPPPRRRGGARGARDRRARPRDGADGARARLGSDVDGGGLHRSGAQRAGSRRGAGLHPPTVRARALRLRGGARPDRADGSGPLRHGVAGRGNLRGGGSPRRARRPLAGGEDLLQRGRLGDLRSGAAAPRRRGVHRGQRAAGPAARRSHHPDLRGRQRRAPGRARHGRGGAARGAGGGPRPSRSGRGRRAAGCGGGLAARRSARALRRPRGDAAAPPAPPGQAPGAARFRRRRRHARREARDRRGARARRPLGGAGLVARRAAAAGAVRRRNRCGRGRPGARAVKVLFVYPRFQRHADSNPELRQMVPMNEYLGSPSLGIASLAAVTPPGWEIEFRDDRLEPADAPSDADLVALSFFTPAAMRAFELARSFREQGKTVVAGGIFPTARPEEVALYFDAVVEGEGEASWARLLADFAAGRLAPRYECEAPVDPAMLPLPRVDLYFAQEREGFKPDDYPVQLSRGCVLSCHACVLPVSMGPVVREFPLEHVLGQLDRLGAAGKLACLTEDTSWFPGAPSRRLGRLFDEMGKRKSRISYAGISMPMVLAAQPSMLARARAAGIDTFYLVGGFDPITMQAFTAGGAKALARAHQAVAKCH